MAAKQPAVVSGVTRFCSIGFPPSNKNCETAETRDAPAVTVQRYVTFYTSIIIGKIIGRRRVFS